jgi:hypothetical protein
VCRRIEEILCRSCINIDYFTDKRRRRNSVVGISQRVGNKLRAFATISDGISDGITDGLSPTAITDETHRRNSSVRISQRVGKKLRAFATISDGISDAITDGQSPTELTDGIVPSISHRDFEKNYGLLPQFPTDLPTEITDGNHTSRSACQSHYYRWNCRR